MFFLKKTNFYHKKLFLTVFTLLFFIVLSRIFLPFFIVGIVNERLKEESPYFSFHIDDIDFKILRGEYVAQGITGMLKPSEENFLKIQDIVAKVSWKGIFKGLIFADVSVDKLNLVVSQDFLNKAKAERIRIQKEMSQEEKKESRLRVNTFTLYDSNMIFKNIIGLKGDVIRKISNINAHARNLTPSENDLITNFNISASVFGPAPLRAVGEVKLKESPIQWDMNTEMKNFDLSTINPIIRENIKAFIHKGSLDFYAEVESKNGDIDGYLKPFVRKLKMDTPKEGFNFTGEAAKIGEYLLKVLLINSEVKTLATKVPFEYRKKKIDIDVLTALTRAVEDKVKGNIRPGIEDSVGRKGMGLNEGLKQAQEE